MRTERVTAVMVTMAVAATGIVTTACSSHPAAATNKVVAGGSADLGKKAIEQYGCGRCHTIPGVKNASALVGPPLIHWSKRSFIAGELANTPDNLIRWIQDPKAVEPGTDMPVLGVTPDDARNIAAYLMTIR